MPGKKRSVFEIVLISVVVALALALGVGLYSGRSKVKKSQLLIQELSMLRSSVSLYNMINRHLPANLEGLVDSTYQVNSLSRPYVEFVHRSGDGKIIDPFGNPYSYDSRSGWVCSTTSNYSRW